MPLTLRVLVVDDVADIRESLGMLLRGWGHEVRLAHDGPSALEAFRCFRPDAVLLDIGLPGMSGWEVARQIRAQGGQPALLIAVTGYGQEEDRARSREASIDIHLVKPADPEELRRVLVARSRETNPATA
jgi:CheY-like chemotaxis protein